MGAGLCMYDVVVKKFMFAISSADEFFFYYHTTGALHGIGICFGILWIGGRTSLKYFNTFEYISLKTFGYQRAFGWIL